VNPLENIAIVLVRPQYAGNIGSVSRAMKNMGLARLILVAPEQDHLADEGRMMATSARDILEKAEIFPNLEEALKGFRWIAGTSGRKGRNRGPFIYPRDICPEILKHAQSVPVAILFGPEDKGLTNEDLAPCHALVSMPTHEGLRSLNLAQAVMVFCYELFRCRLEAPKEFTPRLANRFELDAMYAHLQDVLMRICFIQPSNPYYFMQNIRQFGTRMRLRAKEVQIIRGICRQIDWHGKHCYEQGRRAGAARPETGNRLDPKAD